MKPNKTANLEKVQEAVIKSRAQMIVCLPNKAQITLSVTRKGLVLLTVIERKKIKVSTQLKVPKAVRDRRIIRVAQKGLLILWLKKG